MLLEELTRPFRPTREIPTLRHRPARAEQEMLASSTLGTRASEDRLH
jgi:hypothetical protein